MKRLLFLTLFSLTITLSQLGQAQVVLNYGAEFGFAFSQLPKNNSYTIESRNDKVTEKTTSLISPLLGLTSELRIKKHLYLSAGIQYQQSGLRYHSHRDGNDMLYGGTYTSDKWENQTFHKIALPLSVGYSFKLWRLNPSLFVGFRPNYFVAGNHNTRNEFDHDITSKDLITENEFDPFIANENNRSIKRFQEQFSVGINTLVNQHFKFSVSFHTGTQLIYSEYSSSCFVQGLVNNDYVVSMAYLFSNKRK
jgi:hypothetical protein